MSVGHEEFLFRIVTAQKKKKKREGKHRPQTRGRQTRTHLGATRRGGKKDHTRWGDTGWGWGADNTCPCQWEGGETSASTHFWSLSTLLLSQRRWLHWLKAKLLDVSFELRSLKTQPRHPWKTRLSQSLRITSLPRSYILHSTLQFPYKPFISTHVHH